MIHKHACADKRASYLNAMLPNVDSQTSSSDVFSLSLCVPRCCCQALIARAELYYTADVVGKWWVMEGGWGLPAVAQG